MVSDTDLFRTAVDPGAGIGPLKALLAEAQHGRELDVAGSEMCLLVDALKCSYVAALKTLQATLLEHGASPAEEDDDGEPVEPSLDGERAGLVLDSIRAIATRRTLVAACFDVVVVNLAAFEPGPTLFSVLPRCGMLSSLPEELELSLLFCTVRRLVQPCRPVGASHYMR